MTRRGQAQIDLIIRGICTLRPGVPGMSENIRVRSIVGTLLEHSRVYYFENGGHCEVYIGSSDWMPRNLDRRVEVLTPIADDKMKWFLKEQYLESYLSDTAKARELRSDGSYERPWSAILSRSMPRCLFKRVRMLSVLRTGIIDRDKRLSKSGGVKCPSIYVRWASAFLYLFLFPFSTTGATAEEKAKRPIRPSRRAIMWQPVNTAALDFRRPG